MKPDFSSEKNLTKAGYKFIAGMDEVGRGCFAGPVVAGCVVFGRKIYRFKDLEVKVNDSKKLSQKQREIADKWIRDNAHAFGLGQASVAQINRFGIKKATEIAFRKAIKDCEVGIDHLLIDAFYVPYVKGLRRRNQKAIIKGDTKSISIAAASIIAKVYRDKLMVDTSKKAKYKKYGWEKNKGYGTKEHQKMILKHGVSKLHRSKFVESWIKNSSSSRAR